MKNYKGKNHFKIGTAGLWFNHIKISPCQYSKCYYEDKIALYPQKDFLYWYDDIFKLKLPLLSQPHINKVHVCIFCGIYWILTTGFWQHYIFTQTPHPNPICVANKKPFHVAHFWSTHPWQAILKHIFWIVCSCSVLVYSGSLFYIATDILRNDKIIIVWKRRRDVVLT